MNIWKAEALHSEVLQNEHQIIADLNAQGGRKFPDIHLLGKADLTQTETKMVYETKFFGRLAMDVVRDADEKDVPELIKRIARDLVNIHCFY